MAKKEKTEKAAAGLDADQGYGVQSPEPSASAAAASGAIGPGALAASEKPSEAARIARPERATQASGDLTQVDIENLRILAQRFGGVDALMRWLQLHPDLK